MRSGCYDSRDLFGFSPTAVASSQVAAAAGNSSSQGWTAVAASQVAMTAISGNSTALNAVVTSSVAMAAIIGNSTALNAVVTSQVTVAAVAASQVASGCMAASATARAAVCASDVAYKINIAQQGNFRHNFRSVHSFRLVYTLCKAVYCAQMVLFLQRWHIWYSDLLRWNRQPTVYRRSAL